MNRRVTRWAIGMTLGALLTLGWQTAHAETASVPQTEAKSVDRVWLEPASAETLDRAALRVEAAPNQTSATPVSFRCLATSEYAVDDPLLELIITDAAGNTVERQTTHLFVDRTERTASFTWDASQAPSGVYRVKATLMRRPKFVMLWREYLLYKTSAEAVRSAWQAACTGLVQFKEKAAATPSPYLSVRLAIAKEYGDRVPALLEQGDIPHADAIVRYVAGLAASPMPAAELMESVPPLAGPVELKDGILVSGGRPVFLGGIRFEDLPAPADLDRVKELGLNFAAITLGPKDTLVAPKQEADLAGKLTPFFDKALANSIGVSVSLDPQALPSWFLEQNPSLKDNGIGEPDFVAPKARELAKRHLQAAASYLARQKAVAALSLIDAPRFKFTGEPIRQDFIKTVESEYKSLHALSLAWKAHFDKIGEADIGWQTATTRYQNSPAYRFDWQNFQQGLGSTYVDALRSIVRDTAPALPLTVAAAATAFEPGETAYGVDREKIANMLDLTSCCASNTSADAHYALGYPQQCLAYALLRSFSPNKPLLNLNDGIVAADLEQNAHPRSYIRAALWEAAIAGLNGSALSGGLAELTPDVLDGYASTCLDLNRLAPIVNAFQQAPPEIGILWSMPSKILSDGSVHLTSTHYAYEGSSFAGYQVRFITERQVLAGELEKLKVLVLADTPAVSNAAFPVLRDYIQGSANVVRTPMAVSYDERGQSRRDVVSSARRTVLVRGQNLPTEYLHALDSVTTQGGLPDIPRTTNASGYPIEGVKSRFVEFGGERYLYIVNLRKAPVTCHVRGKVQAGRDLIQGRDVTFPAKLESLDPVLIRLNKE